MVNTVVDGTYRQTNLTNESSEYLAKREELRLAEIELMRHRERVAELRRNLPEGAVIQDYQFEEGPRDLNADDAPARSIRLSELFTKPHPLARHLSLHVREKGVAHHLAQNLDFAVVAAADLPTLRAHARERGWDKLRLLSAGNNTFKYDLGSEDREGGQDSTISVFTRDAKAQCAALLLSASEDGARHSGAWHRSARSDLALHGPHPARSRRLVRQP